jgi:hypothetical protein
MTASHSFKYCTLRVNSSREPSPTSSPTLNLPIELSKWPAVSFLSIPPASRQYRYTLNPTPSYKLSHTNPNTPTVRPHLLICDIQTAFTKAISNYPSVVSTASKLLRASATLNIPVYVTTQNKARLGETIPPQGHEGLEGLDISHAKGIYDKTKFSMVLPELMGDVMGPGYEQGKRVQEDQRRSFAITGIEAHICVSAKSKTQ